MKQPEDPISFDLLIAYSSINAKIKKKWVITTVCQSTATL